MNHKYELFNKEINRLKNLSPIFSVRFTQTKYKEVNSKIKKLVRDRTPVQRSFLHKSQDNRSWGTPTKKINKLERIDREIKDIVKNKGENLNEKPEVDILGKFFRLNKEALTKFLQLDRLKLLNMINKDVATNLQEIIQFKSIQLNYSENIIFLRSCNISPFMKSELDCG